MPYTIKNAVQFVLSTENLRSKNDFKRWAGDMGYAKLYLYIKRLAPADWERIRTPRDSTRYYAQLSLNGYKIHSY